MSERFELKATGVRVIYYRDAEDPADPVGPNVVVQAADGVAVLVNSHHVTRARNDERGEVVKFWDARDDGWSPVMYARVWVFADRTMDVEVNGPMTKAQARNLAAVLMAFTVDVD